MSGSLLRVSAPAKVNLHLGVGPLGADGYHPVETVMHTLELADTVTIGGAESLEFTCSPDLGLSHESNLAYRAARAMEERFGHTLAVSIAVEKRIPAGAGLGGASADAAAVIAGLATLWGLDPAEPGLAAVARTLGADVPFFLTGGAARLTGRGDVLAYTLPPLEAPVVVVRPSQPVSTAEAYRAFDAFPAAMAHDSAALESALRAGDAAAVAVSLYNAMTPSSAGLVPLIDDALALVRTSPGVLGAEMSGSGSAVFGICASAGDAERCAADARSAGFWASATGFGPAGCAVERL